LSQMKFKYGLDDIPPLGPLITFGVQWFAITVPIILIVGNVVAKITSTNPIEQTLYLQRLFFITGISLLAQTLLGHRMPLIVGPATVLLIGIATATGSDNSIIHSSILVGGLVLAVLGFTGLFARLRSLFTPRVVATILVLVAFTLTPMILNLIVSGTNQVTPFENLIFTLVFIVTIFLVNRFLTGIWKSTLILWATLVGSLVYITIFNQHFAWEENTQFFAGFFNSLNFRFSLDPGVLLSFLICFLALSANDLGSIQAVGEILKPTKMQNRITKGVTMTGLLNVLSGIFGVIGPVNLSLSPGVIASTGVASRFTIVPAAMGLLLLSFMPKAIRFMGSIPSVVIGTILIYIMCSQISAGLLVAFNAKGGFKFEHGLILGLPLMLSILISFLPPTVLKTFPLFLRPIIGNGFVIGVVLVLIMEHLIYRERIPESTLTHE
jgi:xanthine/uracil permease